MKTILHGGDYNPDQWLDRPEILDEDFRLFAKANINTLSIGIFAWTRLEPEEGRFDFSWLDSIMDRLEGAGIKAILATPSGAKPAWMSQKYPEILRCQANRVRDLHGARHNHCYSSPVYRDKARRINTELAQRYATHPALYMWHVSNEYGGECHCPLCQDAFRSWLKKGYGNLDALNAAWWSDFWSHRFTDWSQIESPSPQGEGSIHGLALDWRRFVNHQSLDFFLAESAPLRALTPNVPITVNMMGTYHGLDYWSWAPHVDCISWDSYPRWHNPEQDDAAEGSRTAFVHDLNRSLKGKSFLLMESTPSQVNWMPVNRLKKPGMHRLSSLQAIAHGSDSVFYFQWRAGRGGAEKFHGSVLDHSGSADTRVFRDVATLGQELKGLGDAAGLPIPAKAAVIYDWDNRWAIDEFQGYSRPGRNYEGACVEFHRALWKRSIACDVPNQDQDFSRYSLIAAPWLYLLHERTAGRLESFVRSGGILVLTYLSGMVDSSDRCFQGGFPGPLRGLAGVWAEELDCLWPGQYNRALPTPGQDIGLTGQYAIDSFCGLIRPEGSQVLAVYGDDWYSGRPVLTLHRFGKGAVYYLCAHTDQRFVDDLMAAAAKAAGIESVWPEPLPEGVNAQLRTDGESSIAFLMNFNDHEAAGLPAYGCDVRRMMP